MENSDKKEQKKPQLNPEKMKENEKKPAAKSRKRSNRNHQSFNYVEEEVGIKQLREEIDLLYKQRQVFKLACKDITNPQSKERLMRIAE